MKAYTIKNKNGEYLSRYTNYDYRYSENDSINICWTNNETNIRFMSENGAKYTLKELDLMDCKIVEITIEETKNQTQRAIECLKELKENFIISENGYGDTIIERGKDGLTFLEHIYNKIRELEVEDDFVNVLNQQDKKIKELEKQLETTEQMRQELIDEGLKCEQQHIKNQNNIAIECLKEIKKSFIDTNELPNLYLTAISLKDLFMVIDNKIKELEEWK